MPYKKSNLYLKTLALFILPALVYMFFISNWVYQHQYDADAATQKNREDNRLTHIAEDFDETLSLTLQDLQFVENAEFFQQYINRPDDRHSDILIKNLVAFVSTRRLYYQLRYVTVDGMERIKIIDDGESTPYQSPNLQNKSSRQYIQRAETLNDNQYFFSELDLNIENGEIERPLKPVVRLIKPVANQSGTRSGYLIVNIDMRGVLNKLREIKNAAGNSLWLINNKDIWIIAPPGMTEWFADSQPSPDNQKIIDQISASRQISLTASAITSDDALLNFHRIDPRTVLKNTGIELVVSSDVPWNIISYTPNLHLNTASSSLLNNLVKINVMVIAMILLAGFLIARNASSALKLRSEYLNEKKLLENLFEHAPIAIYTKDKKGRFINTNKVAAKIIGRKKKDITGKKVSDLYPQDQAEPIEKNDREVLLLGTTSRFEETVLDENNQRQYFISSKFPIYDHNNEIIGVGGISTNITQQRQTEKELIDKEQRFRGIFDNAYQFIGLLDAEGKVIEANATALEFAGITLDDIRGQNFWTTYWWNYSQQLSNSLKQDIRKAGTGQILRREYYVRGRNDNYIHIDFTIRPVMNDDHQLVYMIVEGRDISQAVADRENIKRNYMMLDAINSFQSGMIDQENIKSTFDKFLEKTLHLTESEYGFIGEVLYTDEGTPYLKTYAITNIAWNAETEKLYRDNFQSGLEFTNLDTLFGTCIKTGEVIIANDPENDPRSSGIPEGHPALNAFLGIPIYSANRLVGMLGIANRVGGYNRTLVENVQPLIHTCGQILNSFQTAKLKKQMESALMQSEKRMRGLIDAAPDGLLMVDTSGKIKLINSQVEVMLGYTRHELIDTSIEILVPDDLKHEHIRYRDSYNRNPEIRTMSHSSSQREVVARSKNGTPIPVEIGLSPLSLDNEQFVIASIRDISERKKINLQLAQSQKMESVGKLTGGIAHDFNNFLGVVIGNLDLLSLELKDNEQLRSRIEKATQAAMRGAELTRRLLAFSRRQTLSPRPINLNTVIADMSEILTRTLGSDINISIHTDDALWDSYIDPHQFENVLLNLAINARDAMPAGGKLVINTRNEVMTHASDEVAGGEILPGKYVIVDIADTGTGISREDQDRIFEPFFTTKKEGKGTGLGLAMVYGFVKQSSGFIKLYSELGYGSSFRIYLPRYQATTEIVEPEKTEPDLQTLNGSEKILVVDDEVMLLEATVGQLENSGYQIISARNGDEAMEQFEKHPDIDMVFTDVIMPGELNGVQLANLIQKHKPSVRVLLASGFPKQALDEKQGQSASYELLSKPYRITEMLAAVRRTLGGSTGDS